MNSEESKYFFFLEYVIRERVDKLSKSKTVVVRLVLGKHDVVVRSATFSKAKATSSLGLLDFKVISTVECG